MLNFSESILLRPMKTAPKDGSTFEALWETKTGSKWAKTWMTQTYGWECTIPLSQREEPVCWVKLPNLDDLHEETIAELKSAKPVWYSAE